jgi:copper(I)-binding protein
MRLLPVLLAGLVGMGLALAVRALPGGWVRYVPGSPTAAAYLVLENPGPKPLKLLGAESPVAGRVSLHTTLHGHQDPSVLSMRPVEAFDLPAKGRLELKPGGNHLMLEALKRPLKLGEKVTLVLRFSDGSRLKLELPVEMR